MIRGHGNNLYHFGAEQIEVDFSSNIAFNNHSAEIGEYLKGAISSIGDYPDPESRELVVALARYLSVGQDQIVVTNGSAEAFYLIAHHLKRAGRDRAAIVVPSFAEYEDSCRAYDHLLHFVTMDELESGCDLSSYDSLWLGLVNNPDGVRLPYSAVLDLAVKYPSCTFIVDRAYNELSQGVEMSWAMAHNIIIVDSYTKSYGVPGLRLGYLIADSHIVDDLNSIRTPWSVNSLSQLAGLYILEHHDRLQPSLQDLIGESLYLQSEISKMPRFKVTPSSCNFFLVEILSGESAAQLQQYLVDEHRILIRDCSNFRGLTPRHFRVAAQSRELCDRLVKALMLWR